MKHSCARNPRQRNYSSKSDCTYGTTAWAVLALGLLAAASVSADPVVYHEPHTGYTEVFDTSDTPENFRSIAPQYVSDASKAGNATFSIAFADVTNNSNVGFDHPTLGAFRRGTALAVAQYLNKVLNTTPVSAPTLDIQFAASQTDGGGALASAGTYFPTGPSQYTAGAAFLHLTTGADPFGTVPDILVTVDFGYNWNSETDVPTGGQFDLATVLLHEYTHGLGFSARANLGTGAAPAVYTPLSDGLLRVTGSVDLFNAAFSFVGNAAIDFQSNDLAFAGVNATAANGAVNPAIYAPGTFSSGSSLSHWGFALGGTHVMYPSVSPGVQNTAYSAVEIGTLVDFGYTAAAASGVIDHVAPTADFAPNLGFGAAPFTATFNDQSDPGSVPITGWSWDFGDPASGAANTSSLQNPSHTYSSVGSYTVTLTATNAGGGDAVVKAGVVNVVAVLPASDSRGQIALIGLVLLAVACTSVMSWRRHARN